MVRVCDLCNLGKSVTDVNDLDICCSFWQIGSGATDYFSAETGLVSFLVSPGDVTVQKNKLRPFLWLSISNTAAYISWRYLHYRSGNNKSMFFFLE